MEGHGRPSFLLLVVVSGNSNGGGMVATLFISDDKCKDCFGKGYVVIPVKTGYDRKKKPTYRHLNSPCHCLRPATNEQVEIAYNEIQERYSSLTQEAKQE
jgi:hypothetical protein